jgi:2-dehydro-3-deoxyphosphogluconate aldolase/(4S)-4-hydroxy-2-oxoglutarate aldolase
MTAVAPLPTGIVGIVRYDDAAQALTAANGLLAAGLPVVEITLTVPDAVNVIGELVRQGHRVLAGTVLNASDVEACASVGAAGVVSPITDPDVVRAARDCALASFPGALTPHEVVRAAALGATGVKIFPVGAVGGVQYVRHLRGPLPDVPLMVTGGVNVPDVPSYAACGVRWVGIGSALLDSRSVRSLDVEAVAHHARAALGPAFFG